jgi:hypothetical protein
MLDPKLLTSAIGVVTPVFVCGIKEEAITLIQSMYKTTVGKPLDAAHAQTVKTAASSPLCIGVAEFAKSIMNFLKINEYKECSFQIPLYCFTSLQEACAAYYKVLWPSKDVKWKPESAIDRMRQRMVQVLFHLTFEDFVGEISRMEKDGSLSINRQGRTTRTVAADWVLQAAYGDVGTKAARKHVTEECRWGHRWWKIASYDGLGLLLLASDGLAKYMYFEPPRDVRETYSYSG